MASVVQGKVERIVSSESNGKTIYALIVNGERYGFYTNNPRKKGVDKGSLVKFSYTESNGWLNGNFKSLEVVSEARGNGAAGEAVVGRTPKQPVSHGGFRDPEVQTHISRQACRNAAIEWVKLLCERDAVAFPAKANAATRAEVLNATLNHYTDLFYNYVVSGKHSLSDDSESRDDDDSKDSSEEDESSEIEEENNDVW
ncbi:MAG: hypothetical protein QXW98_08370 [Candidatus Caldarchaeum sp.]